MKIDRPIAIAITLFIILLLVFFLVMPEYRRFQALQTELGEKRAEYNAEFVYYNAIAETYSELQSRKDSLKTIDDALPSGSNLGNLVYYIQNEAAKSGIIVKSLFLGKSTASKSGSVVGDLGVSLSLLGSYNSLGNFIKSLENSSRIFEISSISFSSAEQGSGAAGVLSAKTQFQSLPQNIYTFSLELITHSY